MPGICQRCKRRVFAAEERLALSGNSWHQECFTCAICNKSLDSTTVTENRDCQEIYCNNCYRTHFAIQGYGFGHTPTLIANNPPFDDCYEVTPRNSKTALFDARARSKPKVDGNFIPPPSWKGLEYWTKPPRIKHYSKQVITVPRQLHRCDSNEPKMRTSEIIKSTPRPESKQFEIQGYPVSYHSKGGQRPVTASSPTPAPEYPPVFNRLGRPVGPVGSGGQKVGKNNNTTYSGPPPPPPPPLPMPPVNHISTWTRRPQP